MTWLNFKEVLGWPLNGGFSSDRFYIVFRIGDKVVGGSSKILIYVTVAILLTFKRPLMCFKTNDEIQRYVSNVSRCLLSTQAKQLSREQSGMVEYVDISSMVQFSTVKNESEDVMV